MENIIRLVKSLYDPAFSKDVHQIQTQLQDLQKSALGWKIADELLESPDVDVCFFGALTLSVKINQDGQTLSEAELLELRQKIVSWIIRLAPHKEYRLATRKLCTALVTYFVLPSVTWQNATLDLARCLSTANAQITETSTDGSLLEDTIFRLDNAQLLTVLNFGDSLASDGLRIEHTGQRFHAVHQRVAANVNDMSHLMIYSLSQKQQDENLLSETFQALENWIKYIQQEFPKGSDAYQKLQRVFQPALTILDGSVSFETAAKFFIEVFNEYDDFVPEPMQQAFSQYISSTRSVERLNSLSSEDIDEDNIAYGELVLAFCNLMAKQMIEYPEEHKVLLDLAHYMTKLRALRTEQNLSNAVVDFWERFALEAGDFDLSDESHDDEEPANVLPEQRLLYERAKSQCLGAVVAMCTVVGRSPIDTDATVDTALSEVRARVADLVQEAFADFAIDILGQLVSLLDTAYQSITPGGRAPPFEQDASAWMTIEATLALMGSLNIESRSTSSIVDLKLQQLFSSPMVKQFLETSESIPKNIRKVFVRILGKFVGFTIHRTEYVNFSLQLLFQCLKEPDLMQTASRAIYRVCYHGRQYTKARIEDLIQATEQFFAAVIDEESKSDIIAAAACSIQALGPDALREQVSSISKLFAIVDGDYQAKVTSNPGNSEVAQEAGLAALKYIDRIAKASQAPDDEPIDLEDDDDRSKQTVMSFWHGEGRALQQQIFSFIKNVLQAYSQDGPILETACQVVKAGYRERTGGPFAFPSSATTELVLSIPVTHPRADCALSLAANFVLTHLSPQFKDDEAVRTLVEHATAVVLQLEDPRSNPDLSYHCMELFGRLIPIYVGILENISGSALSTVASFALKCLQTPEQLPKKAASTFWDTLFNASQRQSHDSFINNLCREIGPPLCRIIAFAIGGQAARSELEYFSSPLRKIIASQSGAKSWLEAGIFDSSFPSSKVIDADKRKLVAQVISLRGSMRTNAVVREFWTVSKGAPAAYN